MIRFRTLGTLDLVRSEGPELSAVLTQPKRLALLAYLALARQGGFHRRDRLLAIFWPDANSERARAALNRAIYFLRRELGEGIIISRGDEEVAVNADRFWCDATAFEDCLERDQPREGLELYRGDLLPGFFTSDPNGFEEWLESERARLRERASEAVWRLADEEEAKGNLSLAASWARRGVELAPFREVGFRRLLALLDAAGDRAGAGEAYEKFTAHMSAELELAPAPETRALIEEIRVRDRATTAPVQMPAQTPAPVQMPAQTPAPAPRDSDVSTDRVGNEPPPASADPTVTPRRARRRRWLAVAATVVVVCATPAIVLARGMWRPFDAHRVYVTPFTNLTGDAAVDALGHIAAHRIIQSLTATGLVEVVAPTAQGDSASGETVATRRAFASTEGGRRRAGIVVAGEIHREGGRLSVQAWITDARRDRVVWAVPPISATGDSAQQAISEVRERTTGAVAALADPRYATWFPIASSPPKYGAFQEFTQGVELQLRGGDRDAVPHLRRAVALDSTFTWAALQLALAYKGVYADAIVDSIADAQNRVRERLMPVQRHWLDWLLSLNTEDRLAGYRAISAAAELAPQRFLFNVAQVAVLLNRPREGIEVLTRLGPDSPYNYGSAYWGLLTVAHHALGDRKRELAAAREARRRYPDRIDVLSFELSALAAYGRTREVRALLDTALAFPRQKVGVPGVVADMPGLGLWPGRLMIAAATEFRAHGHTAAANETLKRAIDWYTTQPPADNAGETHRFELAKAFYQAREWSAAESLFRSLAAADTDNFVYAGFLGTIAARRGDSTKARRVLARFDTLRLTLHRPHAEAGYWQSKLSAVLGDETRAMTWLSDCFGPQGRQGMHSDFDFERMWNSREFREFLRPKG